MVLRLLRLPLALLIAVAAAAVAFAADRPVSALDFRFEERMIEIDRGDSVVWSFVTGGHTTTSEPGQAESWDSRAKNAGATFRHTFDTPGRYQYVCVPHQAFDPPMAGVVQVGQDRHRRSHASFEQTASGSTITMSFRLLEPAKATLKLDGPSLRSVTRRRLARGRHSIRFRRLRAGTYRGTATFVDDFDKRSQVSARTRLR
jgi:plastocyanin